MKLMKMHRPTGFTLAELLIVLAIFCFLLALLMPILSKALKKAREFEDATYAKRSQPLLLVKTADGGKMGLGFHRRTREPVLYSKDEEAKNNQLMLHAFGFRDLKEHVTRNRTAFSRPDNLTEEECDLLRECGFVEWRKWDPETDWKKQIKQMSAAIPRITLKTSLA
jgi:prepilin-type N-terminal cleavage/methylation domain-containing protein